MINTYCLEALSSYFYRHTQQSKKLQIIWDEIMLNNKLEKELSPINISFNSIYKEHFKALHKKISGYGYMRFLVRISGLNINNYKLLDEKLNAIPFFRCLRHQQYPT